MNSNGVWEFPKVKALHYIERDLKPDTWVVVQEKLDGSNVAVRRDPDGTLVLQSRTTLIDPAKPGMFKPFVDAILTTAPDLPEEGEIWYGEMVNNQGKIKYAEKQPFVLFDCGYLRDDDRPHAPAGSFDARYVPGGPPSCFPSVETWWTGRWADCPLDDLKARLTDKHEGFVVKAYEVLVEWQNPETGETGGHFYPILAGKVVREEFKETSIPPSSVKAVDDPLAAIAAAVVTKARVRKAVRRVLEEGGDHTKPHLAIPKVSKDSHDEDAEYVKDLLFRAYWPKLGPHIAKTVLTLHADVLDEMRVPA